MSVLSALFAVSRPTDMQRLRRLGESTSFYIDRQWSMRQKSDFCTTDRTGPLFRHGANGMFAFLDTMDHLVDGATVVYEHTHALAKYFVADPALYTLYLLVWALKTHRIMVVQGILNDLYKDDRFVCYRETVVGELSPVSALRPYVRELVKLAPHVTLLDLKPEELWLPETILYIACAFNSYEETRVLVAHRWCKYGARLVMLEIVYRALDAAQHARVVTDLSPHGAQFSEDGVKFLKSVAKPNATHIDAELARLVHTWTIVKALVNKFAGKETLLLRSTQREVDALLKPQPR
jgi:hypothetical protein